MTLVLKHCMCSVGESSQSECVLCIKHNYLVYSGLYSSLLLYYNQPIRLITSDVIIQSFKSTKSITHSCSLVLDSGRTCYSGLYAYHVTDKQWVCLRPDLSSQPYKHLLKPRMAHSMILDSVS